MTPERLIAAAFRLDDQTGHRHANPRRVIIRNTALTVLVLAAWSPVTPGWSNALNRPDSKAASAGSTAFTNAVRFAVLLPWCPARSDEAAVGRPEARIQPSALVPSSPVRRTDRLPMTSRYEYPRYTKEHYDLRSLFLLFTGFQSHTYLIYLSQITRIYESGT